MKIPAGWYLPTEPGPEGDSPLWNPYWHDGNGNWIEAQTEGHVEVEFPREVMFPLAPLRAGTPVILGPDPKRGSNQP